MAANSRAKAQRETAARVRKFRETGHYERVLSKRITAPSKRAVSAYDQWAIEHPEEATRTEAGKKHMAGRASKARWGKADERLVDLFKQFWYKEAKK